MTVATKCGNIMNHLGKERNGGDTIIMWFCVDDCIVNAHILMNEADNFPYLTQLQFHIELIKEVISEFSEGQLGVQDGAVQLYHWPVAMSKGRLKGA